MKKSNIRNFILGMLVMTLVFGTTVSALASHKTASKVLNYNDIKVTLDGAAIDPKDAKGNAVEPFIIDGTTYLPVRAVAEALGLYVDWDGTTSTVILSTTAPAESTAKGVIYDKNGIRITYNGITKSNSFLEGSQVNLLIENNTNKNYIIQVRDASVNGFMTDSIFSPEVAAGKKINDSILFYKSALEQNNISSIERVEFKFTIFDADNWLDSFDSSVITLTK